MVLDFIALAHETLFVLLAHVRIEFIIPEKAFSAELAQRMDTTLDLL